MADDDTTIDDGYQPPPYVPTTGTTAETEQGGTRAAPAPPPAPRPPVPRPGPAAPPPPKPVPISRPSFFTPWRIAVGAVLVGGAAYAAYELTPRKGRR